MTSLLGTPWGYIGSLDMLGYEETKSPAGSQEECSVQKFVRPEPSLGVSRQNIRRKIKRWRNNQH